MKYHFTPYCYFILKYKKFIFRITMPSSQILGLPKMVQRETKLMYQHELWEHMAMQLQNMSWLVSVIKVSGMIIVGAIVSYTATTSWCCSVSAMHVSNMKVNRYIWNVFLFYISFFQSFRKIIISKCFVKLFYLTIFL